MKLIKKLIFIIVLCLITSSMSGCVTDRTKRHTPHFYVGSTWESEDGKLRFTIPLISDGSGYRGIYQDNGTEVEMYFRFCTWFSMEGCTLADYQALEASQDGYIQCYDAPSYESYDFIDTRAYEHQFSVSVYASSIFQEGDTVLFNRIDDAKDIVIEEFSMEEVADKIAQNPCSGSIAASDDVVATVELAKAAMTEKFGEIPDEVEVYLDESEKCWLIKGTRKFEGFFSMPYIVFRTDGTILAMWED